MSNMGPKGFFKREDKSARIITSLLKRCPNFNRNLLKLNRKDRNAYMHQFTGSLSTIQPVSWQWDEMKKLDKPNPLPIKMSVNLNYPTTDIIEDFKLAIRYLQTLRIKKEARAIICEADITVYDACMKSRCSDGKIKWKDVRTHLKNYRQDSHENTLRRQYNKVSRKILSLERIFA